MPKSIKKVILFGLSQTSSYAWYVFSHDSDYQVVAFTVDGTFVDRESMHGIPVVPFESLPERFPPGDHAMHLPIGWKRMNSLRAQKLAHARGMGYTFASYISSRATVWPDLCVGDNCQILQGTNVSPFVRISDNCLIYSGATIGHHSTIGAHSFIGLRAVICGGAEIGEYSVIGANATIADGVRIAPRCFIGAGSVITRDTEENRVYTPERARLRDFPADQMTRVAWRDDKR